MKSNKKSFKIPLLLFFVIAAVFIAVYAILDYHIDDSISTSDDSTNPTSESANSQTTQMVDSLVKEEEFSADYDANNHSDKGNDTGSQIPSSDEDETTDTELPNNSDNTEPSSEVYSSENPSVLKNYLQKRILIENTEKIGEYVRIVYLKELYTDELIFDFYHNYLVQNFADYQYFLLDCLDGTGFYIDALNETFTYCTIILNEDGVYTKDKILGYLYLRENKVIWPEGWGE